MPDSEKTGAKAGENKAIKELKKIPTYEDLLRENQKLKVDLNKRRNATEKLINYFYNLDNFGKESISIDAKIKMLEILTEALADNKNSEKNVDKRGF